LRAICNSREKVEAEGKRQMTRKTRDEELEAVADMLEMLALEVRAMTGSAKKKAVPVQTRSCDEFCS
jgi:hypothetical protein